jgi:amino acid adenylation domain-containing protein
MNHSSSPHAPSPDVSDVAAVNGALDVDMSNVAGVPFAPEVNAAFRPWPPLGTYASVSARFAAVAAQFPGHTALVGDAGPVTFAELNRRANRVAHAILARCGPGSEPIGLLLPHGAELIVALLAVLKAGKFYMPVDTDYPDGRIVGMARHSGTRLLLTAEPGQPVPENLPDECQTLALASLDLDHTGADDDQEPDVAVTLDDYFNLIYTSGSTGQPKGVLQNHRNVLLDNRASSFLLRFNPRDRVGLVVPCTFGASVADISSALLNGGTLIPFDLKRQGVSAMARWFQDENITSTHMVPTVFRQWMGALAPDDQYPAMRLIKVGGEALLQRDFELFRHHFLPPCILRNALGSTEAYMMAGNLLTHQSQVDQPVIPVGAVVQGREILIQDEAGQAVPSGEIGEIVVRSRFLSPGYWRAPDLTDAAYLRDVQDPTLRRYHTGDMGRFNQQGLLEHLGRKDDQVKIRGQRVEPAEVELSLMSLDDVREAAVVVDKNAAGENRLVAYVVPAATPAPTVSATRRALAAQLPDHMVPAVYVFLDALPLLPFGKVDRRALPKPERGRPDLGVDYAAPVTPLQEQIAEIFSELLQVEPVGIHDNFFDLGGDSLLAAKVASKLEDSTDVTVAVAALFKAPTVAALAAHILQQMLGMLEQDDLTHLLDEVDGLGHARDR